MIMRSPLLFSILLFAGTGGPPPKNTQPEPKKYKIVPLANPPVSLTIGGKTEWAGNPEGAIPPIAYRPTGPGAPPRMMVGIVFLKQQMGASEEPPIQLSSSGGPVKFSQQLAFILFLFGAGKAMGEVYPPEAYVIRVALFEAIANPGSKFHEFGRQVSNPISMKLDIK
jgi:hypothetical protein